MGSVFESIKQGLNEAIEYERGNLSNVKVDRSAYSTGRKRSEAREQLLTPAERAASDLRLAMMIELSQARAEKGISQKKLEEMSGVKQPVIARMERGRTSPQIDTVLRVLAPLGKTLAVVPLEK